MVGNTSVNSSLCIGATVSDVVCIQMYFSEEKWGQWVIVVSNNKIIVFKPAVDYYWWQELLGGTRTLKGSEQCTRTATARLVSDPKTGYNAATGRGELCEMPSSNSKLLYYWGSLPDFWVSFPWADTLRSCSALQESLCWWLFTQLTGWVFRCFGRNVVKVIAIGPLG